MNLQFTEGLSFLQVNETDGSVAALPPAERAEGLTAFYERYLAGDMAHFGVSRGYAPGLFAMIRLAQGKTPAASLYLKGQTVGPFTLAAGLRDAQGRSALYQADLLEAVALGLSIKARWQVREMSSSGRTPILFIDEPYLAGYGSAFIPLERGQVVEVLGGMAEQVRRDSECLVGIHCCGNTDWGMILEAKPDIVSFDAYGFMESFLIYRPEIVRFITGGGAIAWGIVPTEELEPDETCGRLLERLLRGIHRLEAWGLDRAEVSERSLLTPACGMGTLSPERAALALRLLSELPARAREALLRSKSPA
jgi:hypothetical protein